MNARRRAAKIVALVIYIIVVLVATPQAQQPAGRVEGPIAFAGSPGAVNAGPSAAATDATAVDLLVGRSTILNVGAAISRVSLTVPDVADAMVTAPSRADRRSWRRARRRTRPAAAPAAWRPGPR